MDYENKTIRKIENSKNRKVEKSKSPKFENSKIRKFEFSRFSVYINLSEFSTFRVFRFPATVYTTHGNSKIRKLENSRIRIFAFFGLHQFFPNFRLFGFFAFQPPLRTRHTAIRKFENSKNRKKFEFSRFRFTSIFSEFSTFRVFRFPATVAYPTHGNSKIRKLENSKIRIFACFGLHQIF